jgi:hypothetical protein
MGLKQRKKAPSDHYLEKGVAVVCRAMGKFKNSSRSRPVKYAGLKMTLRFYMQQEISAAAGFSDILGTILKGAQQQQF